VFTFDKSARLRKREDFTRLSSNASKWVSPNFIILFGDPFDSCIRLGVTVSKRVGNAVSRNHLKRLIREFYRNNSEKFPVFDYNIIARNGAVFLRYAEVCQELANAFSRIGQRNDH